METKINKHQKVLLGIFIFLFAMAIFGDVSSFVEGFINGFSDATR